MMTFQLPNGLQADITPAQNGAVWKFYLKHVGALAQQRMGLSITPKGDGTVEIKSVQPTGWLHFVLVVNQEGRILVEYAEKDSIAADMIREVLAEQSGIKVEINLPF